jgi:hypothetical protein
MPEGYLPSSIKGNMTTLPADILVDENGVIRAIYQGNDSADHLPMLHRVFLQIFQRRIKNSNDCKIFI